MNSSKEDQRLVYVIERTTCLDPSQFLILNSAIHLISKCQVQTIKEFRNYLNSL